MKREGEAPRLMNAVIKRMDRVMNPMVAVIHRNDRGDPDGWGQASAT
jgi:hypothetical protein